MNTFLQIKKQNGEAAAKAIRGYHNGIFELKGIVERLKYAGKDIEPLLPSLAAEVSSIEVEEKVDLSWTELLDKAGYNAVLCTTEEQVNSFKKYYATSKDLKKLFNIDREKGEVLCTFNDVPGRLQAYHIIWATKKDIESIQRKDFPNPEREDLYGTSCMSIQIAKKGGFISIKNRYNHTVANPDNTYGNNPDNIIHGLGAALQRDLNVKFSLKFACPEGFTVCNNKYIKVNYEVNGVYVSEHCYVANGELHEINQDYEVIADYFLINFKDKTVTNLIGETDGAEPIIREALQNGTLTITKMKD